MTFDHKIDSIDKEKSCSCSEQLPGSKALVVVHVVPLPQLGVLVEDNAAGVPPEKLYGASLREVYHVLGVEERLAA